MKLIFWFLIVVIALALALFAVANREIVSLGLWPLPYQLETPLYLAILAAVVLGFLLGAIAAWGAGHGWRRETRRRGRRIAALERELNLTQAQMARGAAANPSASPPSNLPVTTRG